MIHPPLQFQSRFDSFKRLAEAGTLPQHQVDWLVSMTSDLAAAVSQLNPHVVKRPCEWWAAGAKVQHHSLHHVSQRLVAACAQAQQPTPLISANEEGTTPVTITAAAAERALQRRP